MKELSRIIRRKRREFSMHQYGKTGNGLPFRLKYSKIRDRKGGKLQQLTNNYMAITCFNVIR